MKIPKTIQKLFIFERKEVALLGLLGFLFGCFCFTLGIHLGKDLGPKVEGHSDSVEKHVATVPDPIPSNQELAGPNRTTQQALEESLSQNLHEEVTKANLKLNPSYQTELPEAPRSENAGATTLHSHTASDPHSHAASDPHSHGAAASQGHSAPDSHSSSSHPTSGHSK
jgi:hypothetical protein